MRGYDCVVRALGSAWFLFLAAFVAKGTIGDAVSQGSAAFLPEAWPLLLSRACLVTFYLTIWWLLIVRPPAVAQTEGLMPTLMAFVGTYMPWSLSFLGRSPHPMVLDLLSAVCLTCGTLMMVITIYHLGRSFSLVPQARRLVQDGPYRWVKHPLYLAEEVAVLGTALQCISPCVVILFFVHLAVQVRRIKYEEALLRCSLPAYSSYETLRYRLIPRVW
jgi:protein-S-isoprenylcysteine O-methyltransferase Ste14